MKLTADAYAQIIMFTLAGASSLIASCLALYVTLRLYRFKEDLIKSINGTYVKSEVFRPWKERVEGDVELAFRKIDVVSAEIADVRVDVGRLQG